MIINTGALSGVTTLASSGNWTWTTATPTITISNDAVFQITEATDTFEVNTSTHAFSFTDGTNSFTFDVDAGTGPVYVGLARPPITVTLSPEFAGATLTGDGADNTGTMTSDFCSEDRAINALATPTDASPCDTDNEDEEHNYYSWTANATNDYDVWINWQVPSDFGDFAASNPIQYFGWRTGATETVTLTIYNDDGTTCGTASSVTSNGAWETVTYTNSGCTPSAGDLLLLRVTLLVGTNSNTAKIGEIEIDYLAKF